MSADEVSPWVGASGIEYQFFIFAIDFAVPPRPGVYIYAKKNDQDMWVPLYIGHGDLAARCADSERLAAIHAKGATHVHLRLVKRAGDCVDEVRDMLAKYANAFPPDGCQPEADRPVATSAPQTAHAPEG